MFLWDIERHVNATCWYRWHPRAPKETAKPMPLTLWPRRCACPCIMPNVLDVLGDVCPPCRENEVQTKGAEMPSSELCRKSQQLRNLPLIFNNFTARTSRRQASWSQGLISVVTGFTQTDDVIYSRWSLGYRRRSRSFPVLPSALPHPPPFVNSPTSR